MDIVLGVSMAPRTVRLVAIEGQNADGVTVEQEEFEVGAAGNSAVGPVDQVIDAIIGTREGVREGGHQLTSTGVTWSDPAHVGALREAIAAHDLGGVMLVAPLLAAAALAQTVGHALGYERLAMLFVETANATLAVVDVADGSIVDLHRRQIGGGRAGDPAAELATMVSGLDARGSRADGVFLIGCGTDIVALKSTLEAATPLSGHRPRGAGHGAGPRRGAGIGERPAVRVVDRGPGLRAGPGHRRAESTRAHPDLPGHLGTCRCRHRRAGLQRRRGRGRKAPAPAVVHGAGR